MSIPCPNLVTTFDCYRSFSLRETTVPDSRTEGVTPCHGSTVNHSPLRTSVTPVGHLILVVDRGSVSVVSRPRGESTRGAVSGARG